MENLYSNVILNLINAYSQRISKYASVLDRVNSLDETLFQGIDIKKNNMVTKLSNLVNINIEVLNILREIITKENNMVTLNQVLVNELNEGLKLTIKGLNVTTEELKPTVEGLKPTVEELKPTVEGLKPTVEGLKPTVEELKPSTEGLELINEGIELIDNVNMLTIDFLKEIAEILGNTLCMPEKTSGGFGKKSGEPTPPMLTPEEVREKIIQSPGILTKPFIEYFEGKYKFDKIPKRLAFIMEDIYKNSKTSQMHIKSAARSSFTTVERAFAVLRKQGWIKLETSRRKEKFILTESGKAFVERVVSSL